MVVFLQSLKEVFCELTNGQTKGRYSPGLSDIVF